MLNAALRACAANLDSKVVNFLLSGFSAIYMYYKDMFFRGERQMYGFHRSLSLPNDSECNRTIKGHRFWDKVRTWKVTANEQRNTEQNKENKAKQ